MSDNDLSMEEEIFSDLEESNIINENDSLDQSKEFDENDSLDQSKEFDGNDSLDQSKEFDGHDDDLNESKETTESKKYLENYLGSFYKYNVCKVGQFKRTEGTHKYFNHFFH
jgi:hypothetical protein